MPFAALESVVPEPRQRSATWLSSTYAVDDESEEAKFCSGGYQVRIQPLSCDTDSWGSIELRLLVAAQCSTCLTACTELCSLLCSPEEH